mmetsp:Transcript_12111/g.17219  ORF Transcript_12111/g.17219 Transcript_12111/m.17219 type:complete len:116 (-) Transcript_12111:490-837(-)
MICECNENDPCSFDSPENIVNMLEQMNLLQRARHGAKPLSKLDEKSKSIDIEPSSSESLKNESSEFEADVDATIDKKRINEPLRDVGSAENPSYLMHESVSHYVLTLVEASLSNK